MSENVNGVAISKLWVCGIEMIYRHINKPTWFAEVTTVILSIDDKRRDGEFVRKCKDLEVLFIGRCISSWVSPDGELMETPKYIITIKGDFVDTLRKMYAFIKRQQTVLVCRSDGTATCAEVNFSNNMTVELNLVYSSQVLHEYLTSAKNVNEPKDFLQGWTIVDEAAHLFLLYEDLKNLPDGLDGFRAPKEGVRDLWRPQVLEHNIDEGVLCFEKQLDGGIRVDMSCDNIWCDAPLTKEQVKETITFLQGALDDY